MAAESQAMRIRDRFPVILLDMNGTFMFGEDRFGPDENFFKTYERVGRGRLSRPEVNSAIRHCFEGMLRDSRDSNRYESFLSLGEGLRTYGGLPSLPPSELSRLTEVFARHEIGRVPDSHADYLCDLAATHQLGLVSNIWAPKSHWLREFERAGISHVFTKIIFSSDYRSIKPSLHLFTEALSAFAVAPEDALVVGDSLTRDIEPAKKLGMRTAWIRRDSTSSGATAIPADYVIPSLLSLDDAI